MLLRFTIPDGALELTIVLSSGVYLYTIDLPKTLNVNQTANLVVETVQTHATYPWPAEAAHNDPQSMKYETELLVVSPYKTSVQRTKLRYALALGLSTERNTNNVL